MEQLEAKLQTYFLSFIEIPFVAEEKREMKHNDLVDDNFSIYDLAKACPRSLDLIEKFI